MMRARSWALRDGFADVLRGLSIREEVEDYASTGVPLPEPALTPSRHRLATINGRSAPRPRLVDHIPQGLAVARVQRAATRSLVGDHITDGISATRVSASDVPTRRTTGATAVLDSLDLPMREQPTPSVVNEPAGDGAETSATAIPVESTMPIDASYALVDAEGAFVEVGDLNALRDAFERRFADPHLSPDQVRGLWDSNETARDELERAFGAAVLDGAACRQAAAEQQRETQRAPRAAEPKVTSNTGRPRSKRAKTVTGTTDEAGLVLKIPPAWSDETALRHYRVRLIALKRDRARAATFVDFRRANHKIEQRLRERLPHLAADIDAIYAWAATHAR